MCPTKINQQTKHTQKIYKNRLVCALLTKKFKLNICLFTSIKQKKKNIKQQYFIHRKKKEIICIYCYYSFFFLCLLFICLIYINVLYMSLLLHIHTLVCKFVVVNADYYFYWILFKLFIFANILSVNSFDEYSWIV